MEPSLTYQPPSICKKFSKAGRLSRNFSLAVNASSGAERA